MDRSRLVMRTFNSPTGTLTAVAIEDTPDNSDGLCVLSFGPIDNERTKRFLHRHFPKLDPPTEGDSQILDTLASDLDRYLVDPMHAFETPLAMRGTDFQHRVWDLLLAIPAGETRSYGEIAVELGEPGASRAVGAANGANPVAILVPCHRVVDSRGMLHGYAGGLERKRWLLEHERAMSPLFMSAPSANV